MALAVSMMTPASSPAQTGRELYVTHCLGCHKFGSDSGAPLRVSVLNGAGSSAIIDAAIANVTNMKTTSLSGLSSATVQSIATYLQGEVTPRSAGSIAFGATVPLTIAMPVGSLLHISVAGGVTNYTDIVLAGAAPSRGTVTIVQNPPGTWSATYAPKAGEFGDDSFGYRATGALNSSVRVFTVTIDSPAAPTVQSVSTQAALNADGIDITVSVSGGFANRITAVGASSGMKWTDNKERGKGELTLTTPLNTPLAGPSAVFRYRPPRDGFGSESFSYTAASAGGNAATGSVTVTVQPAPPTASALAMNVPLNTPTALDLKPFIGGSEISGVRISRAPAHGQAAINGTVLTYTPRHNYFGADELAYSAFGILGESTTTTVTVQVAGRPDPAQDADVVGLIAAQSGVAQRFAWSQIDNVQRRLERLHRGGAATSAPAAPPPSSARSAAAVTPTALAMAPTASNAIGELAQMAQAGSIDLGAGARLGLPGLAEGQGESGLWLAGKVELGRRDSDPRQSALRLHSDGITVGVDRRLNERLALGIGLGYTRERTDIGELGSDNRATGQALALYGSWQPAPHLYVDALLGHGRLRMNSRRIVEPIADVALAGRRGSLWFGAVTLGYEHQVAPWLLAPYGRFEFARQHLAQTVEAGGGAYALRYLEQRASHQRLALGLRIEAPQETFFGAATPWLRLEALREVKGMPSARVAYADQPDGPLYSVAATSADRHALQIASGIDIRTGQGLAFGLEYQWQSAAGKIRSQALRLQLSKSWGGELMATLPSLASLSQASGAPLDLQLDASLTWDDNITRGKDAADRRSDMIWRVSASHDKVFEINRSTQGVLRVGLAAETLRRYPELGRAMAELQGELRYRGSGEFFAPTYSLFADAAYDEYRSSLRDGARFAAGLSVRLPLTDRIDLAGSVAHNVRRGRSAVFELADNSLRINLDYRVGERGILYGAAEYRDGDLVSTGRPSLENLDLAEVFVDDDAFPVQPGPGLLSYRFRARTALLRLGANWRTGAASSVDLSWSRAGAQPRQQLSVPSLVTPHYFASQVTVVYLLRY